MPAPANKPQGGEGPQQTIIILNGKYGQTLVCSKQGTPNTHHPCVLSPPKELQVSFGAVSASAFGGSASIAQRFEICITA